ncbi:hypothetical protein QE152_g21773 [Popillia japonica]|uniref:ZAD domain-containing protein n=1 Tax=Popillia japonica TaxID=7064 RepID=A0AAW1KKP4_POPJA
MATTKSNCSLCDRNDILLLYDFVSAQIQNAFFTVNRNLFHKNFTDPIQLCVICSHKVELSSGIVREYKEMCNRNNVLSVKKCFFCEDKAAQLVGFRDNPNEVQDKIDKIKQPINIKHNYRDLRSCIRCLYNLDVWDDIRRKLYLKMDIIDITPVNNNDKTRTNRTSIRATDSQPASDTTSAKKSPASTPNKNNANKRQSANTPIPNKRKERSYRSVNNNTQKENLHWCKYLTNKLKNFQTVQQMVQTQPLELHTSQIDDNDKLFNTLPFVEILVSNQINKDRMAPGEDMETIVISDTEDPASNRRTRKTKAIPKSSPQLRRNTT